MKHGRTLLPALLLLLFLPIFGWAQETPPVPTVSSLPTPATPPASSGTHPITVHAETSHFTGQGFELIGNVSIESEGTIIHAAEATYDDTTKLVLAHGNVSIATPDGNTYWGDSLEFNVTTREWHYVDWSVEYPPGFLGQPFIAPLFIGGHDLTALPGGLRAANARVTTCDQASPHYLLVSRRIDIYPGDKVIAYDTDVYLLGRKILHVPWFYLSLKQHRSPIVPETGRNDFEGYYLRLLYQYVMDKDNLGGVRLDITQRLGIGAGLDHFYTVPHGTGEAFVYGRQGLSEYVLRLDHTQELPRAVELTLHGDVRQNSLFTSQPTTDTNLTTGLSRATKHSTTQFTTTRALNQGVFSTDNTSANLTYNVRTDRGDLFSYNGAYSSFGNTTGFGGVATPANQMLWDRVQWKRMVSVGSVNLSFDKRDDLGSAAANNFSGVQRLPELYLETGSQYLHGGILKRVPSTLQVGYGHFDEEPGSTRLDRYLLNWRLNNLTIPLGPVTKITPQAEVRQTFYGDKSFTALYRYSAALPIHQEFFNHVLTNDLRYSTQQAHGFTPFRFDNAYPYQTITEAMGFNNNRNLRINLTAGRDLQYKLWQDTTLGTDVQFTPNVTMTQAVAYDMNNHQWRDLVSQYHFATTAPMSLNLGTRYDLQGGQLRTVDTNLDWQVGPRWRVQWLGGYDGVRHTMLYNEYLILRDLHCWDAAIYYSYQRKYVYLYFRLKALNLPLPGFGIGRNGQVLDTTQGVPF